MNLQHFKDASNKLYAIEVEFAHLLPDGCVPITDVEAEEIRVSQLTQELGYPIPPVSAAQFRLALLDPTVNLFYVVEDYIAASGNKELQVNWEFRQSFEIDHPLVVATQLALGKTDAQMKAIFALALEK